MEGLQNLGIDLQSILIYVVNFGILLAALTYLLYKPVLNFLDQRRDKISASVAEAEELKKEFAAKLKAMEAEKKRVEKELTAELDNMRSFVEKERTKLVTDMQAEREKLISKAQQEIEARKDQLVSEVESDLLEVITKIVLTVVHNKVPQDVIEASVKEAWQQYAK